MVNEDKLLVLHLNYDLSEHIYDGNDVVGTVSSQSISVSEDNQLIRYIIRVYPIAKNQNSKTCIKELEFTRDLAVGYNCDATIELAPGDYEIMVWSDLLKSGEPIYNADDFTSISIIGNHQGNNAYTDAYRGKVSISQDYFNDIDNIREINISMQRPLARFEFIANDLVEFINREWADMPESQRNARQTINLNDYTVVFYYVGFMPDTYSMFTDRPVDSTTGVMFESALNMLTETEASLGFDYVFVNDRESAVTVRVGVYDAKNELVSMTSPIKVPLKRSHYTVLHDPYLTAKTPEGINIDPNYDGNYTLIIP